MTRQQSLLLLLLVDDDHNCCVMVVVVIVVVVVVAVVAAFPLSAAEGIGTGRIDSSVIGVIIAVHGNDHFHPSINNSA